MINISREYAHGERTEEYMALEGIISLLDNIQDKAVESEFATEEDVFGNLKEDD